MRTGHFNGTRAEKSVLQWPLQLSEAGVMVAGVAGVAGGEPIGTPGGLDVGCVRQRFALHLKRNLSQKSPQSRRKMKSRKLRETEGGDICRRRNQLVVLNAADGSSDRRTGLSCAKVTGD